LPAGRSHLDQTVDVDADKAALVNEGLEPLLRLAGLAETLEGSPYAGPLTDCVYYWLRGDLVKIGHTRCLSKRLKALQPGELLAVEPGARLIEQGRHLQFSDYRQPCDWGTEWFRPGPLLVWHIEAMARLYPPHLLDGLPQLRVPMTQLTRATSTERKHDADAKRRLALWVDMLPQIVAEDIAPATSAPTGVSA
jgi:hypothetical protein